MRKTIAKIERKAYSSNFDTTSRIKRELQHSLIKELDKKLIILHNEEKLEIFDQFFAYKNVEKQVMPRER